MPIHCVICAYHLALSTRHICPQSIVTVIEIFSLHPVFVCLRATQLNSSIRPHSWLAWNRLWMQRRHHMEWRMQPMQSCSLHRLLCAVSWVRSLWTRRLRSEQRSTSILLSPSGLSVTEHLAWCIPTRRLQLLHLVLHGHVRRCGPSNAHLLSFMVIMPNLSVQRADPAVKQALCSGLQPNFGF